MRITLAVALVALLSSSVLAQSGTVDRGNAIQGVVDSVTNAAPVEGTVVEPSSVVSGGVIDSAPIYTESAPMAEGTVVGGGEVIVGDSMGGSSDCGCGGGAAVPMSAPVVAAPVYSAPASVISSVPVGNPCCNQPRGGFFRRLLFGN